VYTFSWASTSQHPPCSALEARPYISTAQLVHGSHNFISSSNVSADSPPGAASNHPLALLRSHGREIPRLNYAVMIVMRHGSKAAGVLHRYSNCHLGI